MYAEFTTSTALPIDRRPEEDFGWRKTGTACTVQECRLIGFLEQDLLILSGILFTYEEQKVSMSAWSYQSQLLHRYILRATPNYSGLIYCTVDDTAVIAVSNCKMSLYIENFFMSL